MNLETTLDPRLWEAVRTSVEARQFTAAILDAIHFLSDVIRERSGLEGDGVALIGPAFGGSAPKLKVNRLQTESERNVQGGVEALLRGIYQAIRNPRSHGMYQDEERDGVAILLFIDYLLRVVDKSRSPFSLPAFVAKLLDPDFVPKERYARLLVNEIPENRRLAVCREVFGRRAEADAQKVGFFFETVLGVMSLDHKSEFLALLSEELEQTNDEATIRFVLAAFPSDIWPALGEMARLRIENKLVRSAEEGRWAEQQNRCTAGSLGTWATRIITQFTLKDDLWRVLLAKLSSSDRAEQDYVLKYFMAHAVACFEIPPLTLVSIAKRGLRAGDLRFKGMVQGWQMDGWEVRAPEHPWRKPFAEALASFTPAPEAQEVTDDEIPF